MYDITQSAITKKIADVDFSIMHILPSEIVKKGELTPFEEQTGHNRLLSYLS